MSSTVMEQQSHRLARAAGGDADSFATLIEPLLEAAYRLAAVMLADRSTAEDAVQEASIKAWRKLNQLRGDTGSLRPWFLSIVANECRMTRRQRWWSVVRMAELEGSRVAADQESSSDLRRALMKLGGKDRLALVLHFYLDLPLPETARALHVSEAAAKARVYRAARRLRGDLQLQEVF